MKTKTLATTTKYLALRQKTEEQISLEQLYYDEEDNKLQLETDLTATKRALKSEKQKLEQLKSEKQLSSQAIIDQLDLIEGLEKGIVVLENLITELF